MERKTAAIIIFATIALVLIAFLLPGKSDAPSTTPENQTPTSIDSAPDQIPEDLKIEDLRVGTGSAVKTGDTVVINYAGTLEDGTPFDNSYDRGEPFETQIGVGSVIKGWDLGVVGMKVGGKRRLTIPSDLGYGAQDQGKIPPNSTLIFDLELLEVK